MRSVHIVMRNCDIIKRRVGYLSLAKTKNVRQRSLWHHMYYRHLHSGVLCRLRCGTMDRVAYHARQVRTAREREKINI